MDIQNTKTIETYVTSSQDVHRLGPFIASKLIKEGFEEVILSAIGAGAVNQAVKSIVNAKGLAQKDEVNLTTDLTMEEKQVNGTIKSAVIFTIKKG